MVREHLNEECPVATRGEGTSARAQQGHQPAAAVQIHQLVAAAHMRVANENLRHGAPAGDGHHLGPLRRVQVDADLLYVVDPALLEQGLGPQAIGADLGGVHLDGGHGDKQLETAGGMNEHGAIVTPLSCPSNSWGLAAICHEAYSTFTNVIATNVISFVSS